MRKHSARKWLHFVLDLLPILVLPIFAIYEINHDHNTPIEVEGSENVKLTYSQYLDSSRSFDIASGDTLNIQTGISLTQNHIYMLRWYQENTLTDNLRNTPILRYDTTTIYYSTATNINLLQGQYFWRFTYSALDTDSAFFNYWYNGTGNNLVKYFNLFDLTEIYGTGNEPNNETFNYQFDNVNYDYGLNKSIILFNQEVVYDNTDLGSQMLYALYKPVRDYFNFNNVFNFGDIYNWFEANMFGGNAPMPIFIVWNIIVYQFLMDLMFLVYSIFMFIIDFTSECLERCFSFSRHGGSR